MDVKSEEPGEMSSTPQRGEEADTGEGSLMTQMGYGTQIAHRTRTPSVNAGMRPRPPSKEPSNDPKLHSLRGLLNKNPQAAPANEPGTTGDEWAPAAPPKTRERQRERPPSAESSVRSNDTRHAVPRSGAPSAGGFQRTSTSRVSDEHAARPEDRMQSTRLPPRYNNAPNDPQTSVINYSKHSPDTGRRNKPSEKATTAVASGSSQSHLEEDDLEDAEPEWLKDTCLADGCGTVSGAQKKLLSCWQKHSAGNDPFPNANIPIAVLNALKKYEIDVDESDEEEDNTASETNSPEEVHDAPSDAEDDSVLSWSSSPAPESPKRPTRPGPDLPPDSSLQGKGSGSQSEPQDSSSAQEAQRVVVFASSNEETAMNPQSSSPPLVRDDDDFNMDMELGVPRALGEDHSSYNDASVAGVARLPATVQVKETPHLNKLLHKNRTASSPVAAVTAQAQQQTSSGTSKNTSSTSIVYSTYKEPREGKAAQYDGNRDVIESEDNPQFYSAHGDATLQDEPRDVNMEDARSDSPPIPDGSSPPRPGQQRVEDQMSPSALPQPSPVLGRSSPSGIGRVEDAFSVKRKSDASPSKNDRPPSKRMRPAIKGKWRDHSPIGDTIEELRREKEASFERFKREERARTKSVARDISEGDTKPDAPPGHSAVDTNLPQRSSVAVDDDNAMRVASIKDQAGKHPPRYTASGKENIQPAFVSGKDAKTHDRPFKFDAPEDVDMDVGTADVGNSYIEDTGINTTLTNTRVGDAFANETVVFETETDNARIASPDIRYTGSDDDPSLTQMNASPPHASTSALMPTAAASQPHAAPHPPKPATIFEHFRHTYRACYTGNERHFLNLCKKMDELDRDDKMVPKWQWDDYIIRSRTDYAKYALQCGEDGEDAEPYHRFYKDNIRETLYTEGIVGNRKTLIAAIKELEGKTAAKPSAKTPEPLAATASVAYSPAAKIPSKASVFKAPLKPVSHGRASAARTSTKAPAAKIPTTKLPPTSPAATEQPSPVSSVSSKSRRSLPPVFTKSTERSTDSKPKSRKERSRQSHLGSSSRGVSLSQSSSIDHSTPANQSSRVSTSKGAAPRAPSSFQQRTTHEPRIPTERTGDKYQDFIKKFNAQQQATAFTGSRDVDPTMRWPGNLHVRPKAEVKRKGYDVLDWKDDL